MLGCTKVLEKELKISFMQYNFSSSPPPCSLLSLLFQHTVTSGPLAKTPWVLLRSSAFSTPLVFHRATHRSTPLRSGLINNHRVRIFEEMSEIETVTTAVTVTVTVTLTCVPPPNLCCISISETAGMSELAAAIDMCPGETGCGLLLVVSCDLVCPSSKEAPSLLWLCNVVWCYSLL